VTGRIYSVGYEGWTLSALIENLQQNRVRVLFDVRMTASSRRPGFSKRALEAGLTRAGIEYVHEPKLGNPPENRDAFRSGDVEQGRRVMQARLNDGAAEALRRVVDTARDQRVAVLCVERSASNCHRQVVIEAAIQAEPSIEVIAVI